MDGTSRGRRQRWIQRAEAAYRRMFEGKSQEELVTLTQRESMAVLIAKELAAFLPEEHVAMDPAAQPEETSTTCCPKCGQPGTPAADEEWGEWTVTTRVGHIRMRRQRWECRQCRIVSFPLDVRLALGTEGYSPAVLVKAVRQASKASSFAETSDDLRELAEFEISPPHLQRLSERIGAEWAEVRDEDVAKFRQATLERAHKEPTRRAAAVMLDGGRLQTRAAEACRGVREAAWRESQVACCLTLQTTAQAADPQPEPPAKFLEPTEAARLASEIKRRSRPASERSGEDSPERSASPGKPKRKRPAKRRHGPRKPKRTTGSWQCRHQHQ